MKNNYLFIAVTIAATFGCYCQYYDFPFELLNSNYDHDSIVVYKTLENQKHSHITFLRDGQDNCYIIKQDKSFSLKAQFQVVLEALSAYMALCMGISAQQVEVLPIDALFPGKLVVERPATIHTLMPGFVVRKMKNKAYSWFSINQGGNPTAPAKGLTEFVIRCMSRHENLPPIVALDTFTANRDRSRKNLLYDQVGDRFYAIDMALVYDMQSEDFFIPRLACDNVEIMIKNKVSFKKRKWKAIRSYYETLLKLLENFPPQTTYALFYECAQKAGLTEKYRDKVAFHDLLEKYKAVIEKAYNENERLVDLLSQLLKESPL